jgi:hypothetical protein
MTSDHRGSPKLLLIKSGVCRIVPPQKPFWSTVYSTTVERGKMPCDQQNVGRATMIGSHTLNSGDRAQVGPYQPCPFQSFSAVDWRFIALESHTAHLCERMNNYPERSSGHKSAQLFAKKRSEV